MDIRDVNNELPKPLQQAMRQAGFLDPRTDEPSLSQWSKACGVHTTTISNFTKGSTPRLSTLQAMADALDVSIGELQGMVGRGTAEPWTPPSGTEKLSHRQRAALNELILSFIESPPTAGDRNDTAPPTAQAKGTPGEADESQKTPAPPLDRLGVDLAALKGERALDREDEAARRRGEENQDT